MRIRNLLLTLIGLFVLSVTTFAQQLVADTSFAPTIDGEVNFVEALSGGKFLIAGRFTVVNGITRKGMARFNADGTLDTSFDANWLGGTASFTVAVTAMKLLPDGKILVAGGLPFDNSSGTVRLRRLNADGSADSTMTSTPFLQSSPNFQEIVTVNQLQNGKIVICGNFDLPNGNAKPDLARYNFDGTYDSTFTTTINNQCSDVEVQPDGKYLIAGSYSTVNGASRPGLTRFNTDDSVDTSFNPISALYRVTELESDGRILTFRQAGSDQTLMRLNPDGSTQMTFPNQLFKAYDVGAQANGKPMVVGDHRLVFGQSTDFNRYNIDGTHDPSLNRYTFADSGMIRFPSAMAIQSDGTVILGGNFTSYTVNSQQINRPYLIRLLPEAIPIIPKYDFDGDGKADIALFRPSDTYWYLNRSTGGLLFTQFGIATDKPNVADYDGDGRADISVVRDGIWYSLRSSDGVFTYPTCGQAGDIPTPQYINGKANCLFFRPSTAKFYTQVTYSPPFQVEFRDMTLLATDKPVIADYDGDGRDDLAIFRDGQWSFMRSNNLETTHHFFGVAGDKPAVGDYDGDGRSDLAVFRPSNGVWYIQATSAGIFIVQWGLAEDIPVPADYDGDGKTDIAVFRPSTGVWYEMRSNGTYHFEQFGLSGDIPAEAR